MIDPAELHRVFPPASNDGNEALHGEAGVLRHEVVMLRQRLEESQQDRERERLDKDRQIDSLSRRLEAADEERRTTLRQLTAILTDQRETAQPPRRGWWRFGKR